MTRGDASGVQGDFLSLVKGDFTDWQVSEFSIIQGHLEGA